MNNTISDLNKILSKKSLDNELDFERASIIERKLRVLIKEHPELNDKRKKLRVLLKEYEDQVWTQKDIPETKIQESDLAEVITEKERLFLMKRKELIRSRLQQLSLSQKDLGKILGHTSISYISELVNGISPFTTHDLIVIHLLLKIDYEDLIPAVLNIDDRKKIINVVQQLSNPKLKINEESLELVAC